MIINIIVIVIITVVVVVRGGNEDEDNDKIDHFSAGSLLITRVSNCFLTPFKTNSRGFCPEKSGQVIGCSAASGFGRTSVSDMRGAFVALLRSGVSIKVGAHAAELSD